MEFRAAPLSSGVNHISLHVSGEARNAASQQTKELHKKEPYDWDSKHPYCTDDDTAAEYMYKRQQYSGVFVENTWEYPLVLRNEFGELIDRQKSKIKDVMEVSFEAMFVHSMPKLPESRNSEMIIDHWSSHLINEMHRFGKCF